MLIHVVARGDTLWGDLASVRVTIESIVAANGITNPDVLVVGQALAIPVPGVPGPPPAPSATPCSRATPFSDRAAFRHHRRSNSGCEQHL